MKINYVLGDDIRTKARHSRRKDQNIQTGDSWTARKFNRPILSDAEEVVINQIVRQSGYFESSKTRDVGHHLIREFIRLVAFQDPVSSAGGAELKSLLRRRTVHFAEGLQAFQLLPQRDRQTVSCPYTVISQCPVITDSGPQRTSCRGNANMYIL